MALFQRNPFDKSYELPYTLNIGLEQAVIIVGLGNPGAKYAGTRHNIGFSAIEELAKQLEFDDFKSNKDFKAEISSKTVGSNKVILVKPQTYMNESGQAVQAVAHFYKVPTDKIVVMHDELSIKFGQVRTRIGGQAAGHNGIKSLISHLGPEFGRIRIGIKNTKTPQDDTSGFVLSKFNSEEKPHLNDLIKESALVANEYIYSTELPHDTRNIII